jgi:four helix bundle protein
MTNDEPNGNDEARMKQPENTDAARGRGPATSGKRAFDLEQRTAKFGEAAIAFAKRIPVAPVTTPIITQLVAAATSVGANYSEADDAESRKDFRHKIAICKKEARESKHWLRMVAAAAPNLAQEARALWAEAKELHLIFSAIRRSTKT